MSPHIAAALERLPHAPPFRFITSLTALEPGRFAEGVWAITGEEEFFRGHFPGEPVVPGVLLGEALAQLAGLVALGGAGRAAKGRLARIDLKFPAHVVPPAEVSLRASLTRAMEGLYLFEAVATHSSRPVAEGQVVIAVGREAPL